MHQPQRRSASKSRSTAIQRSRSAGRTESASSNCRDMDDVCWQINLPVSATFRVEARGGGLQPDFIGELKSIGTVLVPIDDYDPEFDGNRIQPLVGYTMEADGYRDGTWQLRARNHFRTPGSADLPAGEYIVILRLRGDGNWDKQEVLVRIDPRLEPAPANMGTPTRSKE